VAVEERVKSRGPSSPSPLLAQPCSHVTYWYTCRCTWHVWCAYCATMPLQLPSRLCKTLKHFALLFTCMRAG